MKKLLLSLIASIALTGCTATVSTNPTPPTAPGFQNQQDQIMGETLAAAHRFYLSIQAQSASGALVLSPTEKTAFNDFGVSLNVADTVYLSYHNGLATEVAAQAQVNIVSAKQANLPTPVGGK